ncbi:carboxylate-amine ligase [Ulvibacter sp. MAR_2010_11]|uniref:carboxylate-amine ligase n=1 Tax=Ulvibacter sp. MAR_2010_11 TaxID=1250229 RepID=UPI000C2BE116|nr:glutamate-cysteine ligase family protein [Ulvibacter sp. MAR_2010_11]PKA83731.1 carboxylate-amine ligase [Ulvibacter sp. MAR_2010_11]
MAYHLFEVFGIELEYMVVTTTDLKVSPIVDKLLSAKHGSITSDVDNGAIEWSNELVAHVVEMKTNGPTDQLDSLSDVFHKNVVEMNQLLEKFDAVLLPTASHPLMDPKTEMKLWQHSYSKIYALYNRVFNCNGHGWSNVQSMHINLPFSNDVEFEKLHAAIRVLLPIIPALSASSPIFEGKFTGFKDTRMEVYKTNQKEIPAMTGKVIPEQVFTKEAYDKKIFNPINSAIKPYDTENILDHHFLNSRGAIARFDRNAIEIRVIDIQECPKADIAIAVLVIEVLKKLVAEAYTSLEDQKSWYEDDLLAILNSVIKDGETAQVENLEYVKLFGLNHYATAQQIWTKLYRDVSANISQQYRETMEIILQEGTLSTRILSALDGDFNENSIKRVYRELATCLQNNNLFVP